MDPTTAISRKKSVDPGDVEKQPLMIEESFSKEVKTSTPREEQAKTNGISAMGLKVLALLACQNAFKNILMRVVMKDHAGFLLSTAIIIVEILKLLFSCTYIVLVQKRSPLSVILYIKQDWKNTVLLAVPATVYSLQMTLEYIAMANIDPASYSVLVQMKMLTTAFFFRILLKKRYMKKQFMSLVILTVGVMLCNMKTKEEENNEEQIGNKMKGIAATLGIACSSGFASVYTERVIKAAKKTSSINKEDYGLAYTQVQLAVVSLLILGMYALVKDAKAIMEDGFLQNYDSAAFASSLNSAVGGLIVASVLKYADSVLKGYATAVSVVLTGMASTVLFGTHLSVFYGMGMVNVVIAVLLFNAGGLDDVMC